MQNGGVMAKSSTSFPSGKSGNPRGRPPKSRALTALLEKAGGRKVDTGESKLKSARECFVEQIWGGLATGKIKFPDGREILLDGNDFMALAKMVLNQIDGPPPVAAAVDLTSGGQALALKVIEISKTYHDDDE